MVRMSDILRNLKDTKKKRKTEERRAPESKAKKSETRPPLPAQEGPPSKLRVRKAFSQGELQEGIKAFTEKEEAPKPFVPRISPVVMKETKPVLTEDTKKLYEEMLYVVKKILEGDGAILDINKITQEIEKLINELKSDTKEGILTLALIKNPKDADNNYLPYHLLNTCIFGMEAGLALGYEKPKLTELGISALFYDIGMVKYMNLASQQRKLTTDEYNEIKKHALEGSAALEKIKDIPKQAINVARCHHGRLDGSGYPEGLDKESIDEYSRIIGIVDVFEAMTHWRAYRDEFPPFVVIQEIVAHKKSFEYKIIKILIENIGLFSVGSFVELNTREIAQVIRIDRESPFRPVINIISNANRENLGMIKQVNLAAEPSISIKRGITKKELGQKPS